MRRMFMLAGLSALLLMLAVGVAVAVDYKVKQCNTIPCKGTENNDLMYEREAQKRDRMLALDGKDRLVASTFKDDRDRLYGERNDDVLFTDDGDGRDLANGGKGSDRCVADPDDEVRSCNRVNSASTEAAALHKEAEQTGGP